MINENHNLPSQVPKMRVATCTRTYRLRVVLDAVQAQPASNASRVDLDKLPMGPFDRVLGWRALHRLRIHVGDDVLGHDLGCRPVSRPGISCRATNLGEGAEWKHHRVLLPQRMVLPFCRWPECETLLRSEPLVEYRLRVNPAQKIFCRLLIF